MIIGFGSTEKDYENKIENAFLDYIKEKFNRENGNIFSEELIKKIEDFAKQEALNSRQLADSFKDASDFPDRYSSYYCYVLGDCNYICFIIDFSHINRKHAFSPDGWAMFQNRRVFAIDTYEALK